MIICSCKNSTFCFVLSIAIPFLPDMRKYFLTVNTWEILCSLKNISSNHLINLRWSDDLDLKVLRRSSALHSCASYFSHHSKMRAANDVEINYRSRFTFFFFPFFYFCSFCEWNLFDIMSLSSHEYTPRIKCLRRLVEGPSQAIGSKKASRDKMACLAIGSQ